MNKLTERIFDINKRKKEIRDLIEKGDKETKLDDLDKELKSLNTEEMDIEKRLKMMDGITINKPKEDKIDDRSFRVDSKEYRSAFLKNLQGRKDLTDVEKRALDSNSAGAAIPTQTADQMVEKIKQIAPLLNEITLLQVAGDVKFSVEGVRDDATLHNENADTTPASDTLVTVSLGGYEFIKSLQISKTVQTMAINAFESWLVSILSEDIARQIEYNMIYGTGVAMPTGVDYSNKWDVTNSLTVGATKSLAYTDVCNFIGLLKGGYDYNAKFLLSKKTLYEDFMPLKDDSKYNIVAREGTNYLIMGYPVMLSDDVKEHDAYLGDFSKIVGNLAQDITIESSADAAFSKNAIVFRGTALFDCKPAIGEAFVKLTKATA